MSSPPGDRPAPTVSVVVITYNHRPFIDDCIASVLAQELEEDWEVIVADDCSTDGTAPHLEAIAAREPRIRLVSGPENVGAQANLRRALAAARGELVATLEGDDFWTSPAKLRTMVDFLGANPDLAAAGHLTEVRAGDVVHPYQEDFGERMRLDLADVVEGRFPHFSSLVYRRGLLPTTPSWFDGLLGADWPMCVLLADQGAIGMVRVPMSVYRVNAESSWAPLPFAARRLDHLRQVRRIDDNTSIIERRGRRDSYRACCFPLFSGIARTRPRRAAGRLAVDAVRVAPVEVLRVVPAWGAAQVRDRLPKAAGRVESGG